MVRADAFEETMQEAHCLGHGAEFAMNEKQGHAGLGPRSIANMESPTVASPLDESGNEHDLLKLAQLRASAKAPVAPEAKGELAELQTWDEPVDERGHRVGPRSEDDATVGEDLVQQGVDDADSAARQAANDSPDAV
jgi:hypothetical protein